MGRYGFHQGAAPYSRLWIGLRRRMMNRKQMRGMISSQFHFSPKQTYYKKDYIELKDRDDWDGRVIVLQPTRSVVRPPHKA